MGISRNSVVTHDPVTILVIGARTTASLLDQAATTAASFVVWYAEQLDAIATSTEIGTIDLLLIDLSPAAIPAALAALPESIRTLPAVLLIDSIEHEDQLRRLHPTIADVLITPDLGRYELARTLRLLAAQYRMQRELPDRAEAAALRASEHRLRMIVDNEPECVKVVAVDGRLLEMNPAGLRMIEADHEGEVLGKPVLRLIHPEDRTAFVQLHRRVCRGASSELQFRIIGLKGTQRWMETHATPLREPDGSIHAILSITRDISDRRQAETALRISEERFRRMFMDAAVGIAIASIDGRLIETNQALCRMLGYTEAELHNLDLALLTYPDDRPLNKQLLGELLAGQRTSFVIEKRYLKKSGEIVWARLSVSAQLDTFGHPVSTIGVTEDITQQREAERQLRESEERFRLLSRATNDALWDWDMATNNLWWNDGFETLFGFQRAEVESTLESWINRIHPEDRQRITDSLHSAIDHGQTTWIGEYRFIRRNGSYADVIDRGYVIRDDEGRPYRMVGGMTDVSERKNLEFQLLQSQKMESVGQLTGGVAHDFNNLLTVILGNAELLAEELAALPNLQRLASTISDAAQRGAELTQRLLAFARRQALDPKPTDINTLIAGIDTLLRRTLGEHVEIELVRAAGLWHALVDPAQLESALLNLCINARDAMPTGGRLTIETANVHFDQAYADQFAEVQTGQYVMLAVSDTGSGIATEHLTRVFEPFFTTKDKGKGTGLGLSMVYGFVKQSQGHITLYSEPGQGTVIKLYLPRATNRLGTSGGTTRHTERIGGHETILLVEDDEQVRQYARQQLISLGYIVLEAANGPEALAILHERDDIDLLFTDIVMPGGMSGRDLADAAYAIYPQLKVLYTSGYTENAIIHQGRLDPGIQLLTKPYRRADLARKIREALAAP
ncbi:MAG TPA: PAS domain S-box protein [Roseiflexaceae bacterium]|nr:PAS domain S-box protein [Roseiflexaceae bacterium]